tara:strand:- start:1659 stop:1859 length:201 start_codon:yes stop_codon:yes gene_type:complete
MPSKCRTSVSFSSKKDYELFVELATKMQCSESSLASLAISEWLRDNYFRMYKLYSKVELLQKAKNN